MVFRAKVDAFFVNFMLIVIIVIGLGSFFPFFMEEIRNEAAGVLVQVVIILTSIFLIVISFILWVAFSVRYVFYQDYLFIKGGPFRSRIPYENITKVSPTTKIFTGHRILSSRDAIEIFNKTTFMGSMKTSPSNRKEFISELKKRCPNIQIQE
nr:PH domain-containing protein [Paenibacillus bovis]